MKENKFTIFTPCYNGEKTIHRVFESVKSQTYTNYEWYIVNDGSTDNSKRVIEELINQSDFQDRIVFINQDNCGKHITWNRIVEMAKGDYFICADCDDSFVPDTLEYLNEKANEIDLMNNDKVIGINVCTRDPETGKMHCNPYPSDNMLCDYLELEYKYECSGEHWYINKTSELKKIKFPEIKSRFYPENRVWYALSVKGLKQVCYNKCLRDYFYSPDGLCNNKNWEWRIDLNKAKMYLHYYAWMVMVPGRIIFKYSPLAFFGRIKMLIMQTIKYIVLLIINLFPQKRQ